MENGQLVLKRLELPNNFQAQDFKDSARGGGLRMHDLLVDLLIGWW